jgi:hypothetical protein
MHKVAEGETLASIGKRYGATAGLIAAANKLQFGDPVAGDRLVIPSAYTAPASATRTPARITAAQHSTGRRAPAKRRAVVHTAQNRTRPASGAAQ